MDSKEEETGLKNSMALSLVPKVGVVIKFHFFHKINIDFFQNRVFQSVGGGYKVRVQSKSQIEKFQNGVFQTSNFLKVKERLYCIILKSFSFAKGVIENMIELINLCSKHQ